MLRGHLIGPIDGRAAERVAKTIRQQFYMLAQAVRMARPWHFAANIVMTRVMGIDTQPQLWGGVECSAVRIRDYFYNQLEWTGHYGRIEDLDLFADIGFRAIRYPMLWECIAPRSLNNLDWSWTDARLRRLAELNIYPIAGFLHHGSGPIYTSLIDPEFPEKLARFARAFAERYPNVKSFTPINEPLTTARFSGLYGHWYPHKRDSQTFVRALFLQCKAIVLSMRAIRQINPAAQLIQTEDVGKCFSTRKLAYQATFENERRWLTFDLLSGRVNQDHPMWEYLLWAGLGDSELKWLRDNPCPPDIIGMNYYLTSERFLDERIDRYPTNTHGGNEKHRYADIEAVRVLAEGLAGPRSLMEETWRRYNLPVAITEAHLNCTREEQLRWLKEIWDAACDLRRQGADIRAVTVWSLLGAFDWNSLMTRIEGHYEPGAFDLRSPRPRPTALARMARDLAKSGEHNHPLLAIPGWWHRLDRLRYVAHPYRGGSYQSEDHVIRQEGARPLLIAGGLGTLGSAFARMCRLRGIPFRLLARKEMDISDRESVEAVLAEQVPWGVVNAAGYVRVDDAEQEIDACYRDNSNGPGILASVCAERGIAMLTFSSDLVFDGAKKRAYVETDPVLPLNVYGKSKAAAEKKVLDIFPSALVVRTSAFFGPWDEHNFVTIALSSMTAGRRFVAADDVIISPTYVPDLVNSSLDLLIDGECGIWHLANLGEVSWAGLAVLSATAYGLNPNLVEARPAKSLNFPASRPPYSALGSDRGRLLPTLEDALCRYISERWNSHMRSKGTTR